MADVEKALRNYEKLGKNVVAELETSVDGLVKSSAKDQYDKTLSKAVGHSEKFANKRPK